MLKATAISLALCAVTLALSACHSSSGGGGASSPTVAPLSLPQTTRFQSLVSSQSQWTDLVSAELQTHNQNGANGQKRNVIAAALRRAFSSQNPASVGSTQHSLTNVDQNCLVDVTDPDKQGSLNAGTSTIPTFKIDIGGPQCPLVLTAGVSGETTATGLSIHLAIQGHVQQSSPSPQMDVDAIDTRMEMVVNISKPAPGVQHFDDSVHFTGKGHSLTEGDFTQTGTMTMSMDVAQDTQGSRMSQISGNSSLEIIYTLRDFSADLKATVSQQDSTQRPTVNYTLNGQALSEAEFDSYAGAVFMPVSQGGNGSGSSNGPSNGPVNPPPHGHLNLRCKVQIYKEREVNYRLIEEAIEHHAEVPREPFLQDRQCNHSNIQFKDAGNLGELVSQLSYSEDSVILYVRAGDDLASSQVNAHTGIPADVGGHLEGFTYRLRCERAEHCE
jgi:hypothetical protein